MLFGERLVSVRKAKKISQDELAKRIGAHAPVIGRYERGEVKPSIDVATKIADALEVSLDYLVGHSELHLEHDILDRVLDIQKLSDKDQEHLFAMMDAYLRDAKARVAYS